MSHQRDIPTPTLEPAGAELKLAPGVVIDGYQVKRQLGAGAMGEVYLALDLQLGRKVALKFVKTGHLTASALERFVDEARLTARFSHPHIVTVYGAGIHLARPYIALEYLDGATLRERLAQGPMPVREVMRVGRSIAEALAEAHKNSVVHADLKPDNVVLPRDGRPRVVDFGVARLVGSASDSASGTPAYMAPERWASAPPAPPIDVWALGILLCECLDGTRPLTDKELVRMAYEPLEVVLGPMAAVSPLAELLSRCLAHRPESRPPAAQVANELDGLLQGRQPEESRSPFRGLEPFTEADAQDFHGRAADTDAIVEALREEGLVAVVGPSGVGKSSFIQAGVLPRLREARPHLAITFRPGRKPLTSLLAALQGQGLALDGDPLKGARGSPGFLVRALALLAALRQSRVVLVIDQFEEAITLGEPEETQQLLDALAAASVPDEAFRVLLAVRSDFLGNFVATSLEPSLRTLLVLRPLSQEALQAAFLAPLRRVGYRTDRQDLPARMAKELFGQAAALPLLQFAADALWRRRDSGQRLVLTREYEAMGGATGALATHAERLALDLSQTERGQVRTLLLQLVNVDGTRRPRTRAELLEVAGEDAAAVLDRLLANRLLVSGQDEATGQPLVELAHESLTTTWPALARWLAETQEARRLQHELDQAAVLWASRGRSAAETWRGDALRDAVHRAGVWKLALTPVQREFLEAGQAEQARLRRRRQVQLGAALVGLGVLAVAGLAAALVFREKEREAIAQQAEIRMAAADMGRFELVLEPFDWDGEAMVATPVSAASLPGLSVRFHELSKENENEPGELVDPKYVVRGTPRVEPDGSLREVLELRSRPTWVEFAGRGGSSQTCASSWLKVRGTPSYSDRGKNLRVAFKVPTCMATYSATVEVPAGPFYFEDSPEHAAASLTHEGWTWKQVELPTYRIDTYEVTQEAYGVYATMASLTGDEAAQVPPALTTSPRRIRMAQVDALMAERFCLFVGKRLQSAAEWRKAARGGLWLDAERKRPNPMPKRVTPWGDLDPRHANLALPRTGLETGPRQFIPVGSFPDDVSPYGVHDLIGGGMEWTRDWSTHASLKVRAVMGGDHNDPEVTQARLFQIDGNNTKLWFNRGLGTAFRCTFVPAP